MRLLATPVCAAFALAFACLAHAGDLRNELAIVPHQWRIVQRESGPDNYYSIETGTPAFIRGRYRPPEHTAVLGYEVPEEVRSRVRGIRWTWRPIVLPKGGDECALGRQDSSAVVYLTFKRALRWYTLKYVWSSIGSKGAVCERRRGVFVAQDTIILESGGPIGVWRPEQVDFQTEFRAHFEDGRADAEVPPLVGIGLMCDGDQTASESSADFANFVLTY